MNKKGITLIALAITILVMTILGAAAVGSVVGIVKLGRINGYESTSRILREQVDVVYRETMSKAGENETFDEAFNRLYPGTFSAPATLVANVIAPETISLIAGKNDMSSGALLALPFYRVDTHPTKKVLGIESTELNFYVNFEKNIVFSMASITIDDKEVYTLEEIDPTFSIGNRNVELSQVRIGDIIIYDPTAGVEDTSLLTYTSVVGSAKEGENVSGNGHSSQPITATDIHNQYIVIGKENGRLKLMAIKGTVFPEVTFSSGQGFLYAEEELHKMCSIFGHGIGADKSNITTYTIGSPTELQEVKTKKLRDTGARSITIEDLQEMSVNDLSGTRDKSNPTVPVNYPTLYSELANGKCKDENMESNLANTYFSIPSTIFNFKDDEDDKYDALEISNIFSHSYFLANRLVNTAPTNAEFMIGFVDSTQISGLQVTVGGSYQYTHPICIGHLRPIVFLSPDVKLKASADPNVKWEVVQE